jgi:hypothetical protein
VPLLWFAAVTKNISNVSVIGCNIRNACTNAVLFNASGGVTDAYPILQGNDFDGCTNDWSADGTAVGIVFPIIAGNRNGRKTMVGTVDPDGTVIGIQGDTYIRQNGNSTTEWRKPRVPTPRRHGRSSRFRDP